MRAHDLADGVRAGNRRSLARALTLVEDGDDADLRALVAGLHPHGGRAWRIGVTGSPGVGKSTLTSALVAALRGHGRTVAVLAVDPSSPHSGGALLGDRVRMGGHATDDGVFIRSMASRGHLGGLSWAAPHGLLVLDAAGFDVVVVETVGVGQAEVEVASVADTTVVVQAPGMGDAVQAVKAGILEVADVHVVNKADREGAERTARELEGMLGMRGPASGWDVPVIRTVAASGEGVERLLAVLTAHREWAAGSGELDRRRRAAAALQIREVLLAAVRRRVGELDHGHAFDAAVAAVAGRTRDPYAAAEGLLGRLSA